jgi:MFS family permease
MSTSIRSDHELWRGRNLIAGGLIGMITGVSSMFFYTAGLFILPLQAEFNLDRSQASLGALVGGLTLGCISPFTGRLVDLFGPYRMALASACGLICAFMMLGTFTTGLLPFLILTVFLNLIGSATSPVVYGRVLIGDFNKRLGLAYGIIGCGVGIGALIYPVVVARIQAIYGWKGAYVGLGIIALIALPMIAYLLRHKSGVIKTGATTMAGPGTKWDWRFYLEKRFVIILLIFFLASLAICGTIVHLFPMLKERGVPEAIAASILSMLGLAVIIGRLITGFLLDVIETYLLAAIIFLLSASGLLMLFSGIGLLVVPAVILIGFGMGAELDLSFYLIGRRFPESHFSTLFGGIYFAISMGVAFGPYLAGLMFDAATNYNLWCVFSFATLVLVALLCLLSRMFFYHGFGSETQPA